MSAKLVGWRELAPETRHFDFEIPGWDGAFTPGQFVSLTRTTDQGEITRAYSIASPPRMSGSDGARFSLCANLVPDGKFTPFLFGLQPGQEVAVQGILGTFNLRPTPPDSLFVATGTGIAPFRSILLAQLGAHPDTRFTLVFGVRYASTLLYDAELRALEQAHPNFEYRPTVTRPDAGWTGRTGRVHDHALEIIGDRRDMDVYICGLREMVDELRARLKAVGLDRKRMVYERYD
jgi:ferredoxin-NADP reductase